MASPAVMEVEVWLAYKILLTCLMVAILHKLKGKAANTVASLIIRNDLRQLSVLENDITVITEQMETAVDMAERVNLWNEKKKKNNILNDIGFKIKSKLLLIKQICSITLAILIEVMRISVVLSNRSVPVARLQPETVWPLAKIFSYPTGIPGALGTPVWCGICLIIISKLSSLL